MGLFGKIFGGKPEEKKEQEQVIIDAPYEMIKIWSGQVVEVDKYSARVKKCSGGEIILSNRDVNTISMEKMTDVLDERDMIHKIEYPEEGVIRIKNGTTGKTLGVREK